MNKNKENPFAQVETSSLMSCLHPLLVSKLTQSSQPQPSSLRDCNLSKSKNTASLKNNYSYQPGMGKMLFMFLPGKGIT